MLSNYKIPGFILVSLGGLFLSSGGTLFKLFETSDVWAIYFWRSFFFTPAVLVFLFFSSKNKIIDKFKSLGLIGIFCAALYATGSGAYMFAMKHTTVANVLFIISTQTFMLAVAEPNLGIIRTHTRLQLRGYEWSLFEPKIFASVLSPPTVMTH